MQEKLPKNSNIKERIIQFIDIQRIKKVDFFKKIGQTSANFRGAQLESNLNSTTIETIITHYPELNLHWLITGDGPMLAKSGTYIANDISHKVEEPPIPVKRDEEFLEMQRELIRSQKDQISCYKELISELKKEHTDYVPGLDISKQELKK